jgi:integrase
LHFFEQIIILVIVTETGFIPKNNHRNNHMARPRKRYGISAGGYQGQLLIITRNKDDKIVKINSGTKSRSVAKKNAEKLIAEYFHRLSLKQSSTEIVQDKQTDSIIDPNWTMSKLESHWFDHMGGTVQMATRTHIRSAFRSWVSLVGDTRIKDVNSVHVASWHRAYLNKFNLKQEVDQKTSSGLRNYHADLQAVWGTLVFSKIVPDNPFKGNKPKSVDLDPKGRAWNSQKFETIIHAAHKFAKESDSVFAEFLPHIIVFLKNTGLRPKELVNLKMSNIYNDDFGRVCAHIDKSSAKNGKARKVPLNAAARNALEMIMITSMERIHDGRNSAKNAKKIVSASSQFAATFKQACQYIGRNTKERNEWLKSFSWGDDDYLLQALPKRQVRVDTLSDIFGKMRAKYLMDVDCVLYDCRHTFAVDYLGHGGVITNLAAILGHSDIKLTQRYARTNDLPSIDFGE